jgi:chemotaxis response regulator CheB
MRAAPSPRCHRSMHDEPLTSRRLRVLILDDHAIYRTACRALLMTEGLDIVADLTVGDQAIEAANSLRPDIVIVGISPGGRPAIEMARRLTALPDPTKVVLTSSADRSAFGEELDSFEFIPKADICAERIGPRLT